MRQQLRDMGYDIHERDMYGPDFGDLEARTRYSMVAVSRGIPFNFEDMPMPEVKPRKLAGRPWKASKPSKSATRLKARAS